MATSYLNELLALSALAGKTSKLGLNLLLKISLSGKEILRFIVKAIRHP